MLGGSSRESIAVVAAVMALAGGVVVVAGGVVIVVAGDCEPASRESSFCWKSCFLPLVAAVAVVAAACLGFGEAVAVDLDVGFGLVLGLTLVRGGVEEEEEEEEAVTSAEMPGDTITPVVFGVVVGDAGVAGACIFPAGPVAAVAVFCGAGETRWLGGLSGIFVALAVVEAAACVSAILGSGVGIGMGVGLTGAGTETGAKLGEAVEVRKREEALARGVLAVGLTPSVPSPAEKM